MKNDWLSEVLNAIDDYWGEEEGIAWEEGDVEVAVLRDAVVIVSFHGGKLKVDTISGHPHLLPNVSTGLFGDDN